MTFHKFFAVALLTACSGSVLAQAVIKGVVLDAAAEPVIGATVYDNSVDPARGTVTDFDGNYELNVPAGTYSLKFSYVGLQKKTVTDIVANDGKVTFLDVTMSENAQALQEVVVTARAIQNSENAVLLTRLKSDRILDGISSQEMSKLAISNAAGAMTKVTGTTIVDGKYIVVRGLGDRYSTAQLNGLTMPNSDPYRNSPQLDLVPASLLDNIQTSKTFTPDQPGGFTGGNVDLKTKDFPELKTFSVSVSAGYNSQSSFNDQFQTYRGGSTDWLGYDDGTRQLPDRIRELGRDPVPAGRGSTGEVFVLGTGVIALSSTDEANAAAFAAVEEATELLPLDFATQTQPVVMDHSLGMSFGNSHELSNGRRFGYLLSGNYSRSYDYVNNGEVGFYRLSDPNATELNVDYRFRDTSSVESPTVSGFANVGFRFAKGQTISANLIYNHTTDIGTQKLVGPAPALNITQDQELQNRQLTFLERSTLTAQLRGEHLISPSGDLRLQWAGGYTLTSQDEPNRRLLAAIADYSTPEQPRFFIPAASIARPLNFFRDLDDDQYEGKVDVYKDFKSQGHKLQAGVAYRTKQRSFEERIYELGVQQRNIPIEYDGNPDNYFRDENLGFGATPRGTMGVLNYVRENTNPVNSYDGHENIAAAYLMGTYKFNEQLRAILGARVEHTDLESVSRAENVPDSVRIGSITAIDLLPSINLVYSPAERHNVRASFTQTIARPNMREIARFPSFDFIGGPIFSGNPQLERTNIDNYDLRYEFFPTPGALLSVSGFYKAFHNPIVTTFLPSQQLEFSYVNVERATVLGIELEARSDLGFIGEGFKELRAGANVSVIGSDADINPAELARIRDFRPDFQGTRQLQGQSPYIVNANLSWAPERYGFDVTAAFNIFGDRIAFNGNEGTPDIFERARGSLDVSLGTDIGPLGVRLAGTNLLNPKYETFAEFGGQDFIYSSFRRGTQVSLAIGYVFRG